MGENNLDKLFQEKLKDFSDIPEKNIWQSIEVSLNEKKKKPKIIPLWYKLGGVAALLIFALYIINPFQGTKGFIPQVTDIENTENVIEGENQQENILKNSVIDTDAALVNVNSEVDDDFQTEKRLTNSKQGLEKNSQNSSKENKKESLFKLPKKSAIHANQVTSVQSSKKSLNAKNTDHTFDNKANRISPENVANSAVIENNTEQNIFKKNTIASIPITTKKESTPEVNTEALGNLNLKDDPKKKSIFDEIKAQEDEEFIAENNIGSKWSAGPSIAPVYYDGIGSGSPVDAVFSANSKSGDVNFSYGLTVAYKVNKKLSIRSGIHKVDYGYDTNDVVFSSSLQASNNRKIGNIDFSSNSRNLVLASTANGEKSNVEAINNALSLENTASDISAKSDIQSGVLAQQIGYLEVPVELNYALVDKRFGVNLIGGISSLFLVDNSISVSSGDLTTDVGEANNINAVNFSTNVGLGVNYKVTPKILFNIEPLFKYQLNTFSDTDGSFNPFSIGIYSGLNFKF